MKRLLGVVVCMLVGLSCIFFPSCKKEQKQGSRYEINAEYREDAQSISGVVKVTFVNLYDKQLQNIKFNLYPNAYRKNALYPAVGEAEREAVYYDGESYGEITVTSVNGAKSWAVEGVDENILNVSLLAPLSKNEQVTLDLSFVTELAKVEHYLGVGRRMVTLVHFYPRLCVYQDGVFLEDESNSFGTPFRADCADYTVRLTIPSGYELLGGEREVVKGLESKTKYEFIAKNARDFSCALTKKADISTLKTTLSRKDEVGISCALFGTLSERVLWTAKSAVEYFSEKFGVYPYATLTIIQSGGVMEEFAKTSVVFIAENLSEEKLLQALVRAIARQWWGIVVGSDELLEAWQSESFARYSAICFFDEHAEYNLTRTALVGNSLKAYRGYFSVYGSIFGGVDTRMSRPIKSYANAYEYERLVGDKGVIMLDTLRKGVGDKAFFECVNEYYNMNRFQFANPVGVYESFSKNGVDSKGVFQAFLLGKAVI